MNREQFFKVIFFLKHEDIIDTIEGIFKGKIPQEDLMKLKEVLQERYERLYDKIPAEDIISPYLWLSFISQMGMKNRDILLEYIENTEL